MPTKPVSLCQWSLHPHILDMWPGWRLWRPVRRTRLLWWVFTAPFILLFFLNKLEMTNMLMIFHLSYLGPSLAYPTCFPLTQFTCANGRCININWRCDNGNHLLRLPHSRILKQSNNWNSNPVWQTMTAGTTVMKPAAAIHAPVSSLNVTVAAASQNTGPVTATMTVETTVTRPTPTAPTRVRNSTPL